MKPKGLAKVVAFLVVSLLPLIGFSTKFLLTEMLILSYR